MVQIHHLTYEVVGRRLFHGLSFSLQGARKYGLVGTNGIGKSSLARLISGELAPTEGHVTCTGKVFYFAQREEIPNQTVAEYLIDVWENSAEHAEILSRFTRALDFEKPLAQLSGGEWMRLRLAKVLSLSPEFLILDEPSNHLDFHGKKDLFNFIRSFPRGLLLISHDRELLGSMDEILELTNQGLSFYGGNFQFYSTQRNAEEERQKRDYEILKREIHKSEREREKKLDRQNRRMREAKKSAVHSGLPKILLGARKRRAQVSLGRLVKQEDGIVNRSQNEKKEFYQSMKLDPFLQINFDGAAVPAGKEMVHVQDFNWRFASEEKNLWNQPLSLHLRGPQRWHIQGANGSGKSTLLKLIASFPVEGQQTQGLFKVGAKIIGYLDQKFALFDGEKTLFDYFREQSRFDEAELRNQLALYGFSHDRVLVQIKNLSGGEMLRMSLARLFLAPELPDLIVLDEPTNNLDFQSIELLEKALDNYCGALIVVSHDRELTRKLNITHVLSLSDKIFSV